MAVSHVKSLAAADFTGTVTVFNSQGSTTTAAATDLVRPSNWNEAHNQFSTLSGNTANSSALSGTNIVLQGGNNITLSGVSAAGAATIVISGPNTAAQSVQPVAVSGSNGSFAFSTASFGNSNGLSFYTTNGSVVGSYTVPTQTVESNTLGISNLGNTAGTSGVASGGQVRVLFAGGNNVTLSQSVNGASATITISGANTAAQTVESQTLGISNLGNTAGTSGVASGGQVRMLFAGGNNVTLSQSINGASGTITISGANIPAQTVESQTLGISNLGNTSGTSGVASGGQVRMLFAGGNNITLSQSINGASGTITVSGPSLAAYLTTAALSDHSHGNPTLALTNLTGTTASNSAGFTLSLSGAGGGVINQTGPNIAAGTQTATSGTVVFSNSNNVSFGMSDNSVVTASASFAGGGATLKGYLAAAMDREWLAAQIGNQQCFVQPCNVREAVQFEEVVQFCNFSNASNSSNSGTLSLFVGIYTRNNSTLSLVTSASKSFAVTASGTVGSYSIYGGMREYGIPLTTTLEPNNYWIALLSRTTTGGGAGMTWSNFVASQINSAYSGRFSSANNATNQFYMGMGSYNTTTTAIPGSIGFNQINGSAAVNNRPVVYKLVSQDLN